MKAKITGLAPQLMVTDVTRTAEYYRDVLGFSILGYFMDPPVYGMVARDGYQVHFGKAGSVRANKEIRSDMCDLILWAPEIELFYEEVKANKANIIQDIVQRSYGREFLIEDIDGHRIMVGD